MSGTKFPNGITANITGDVTGNLTGNVTGNVTGALTGNATTATTATDLAGALKGLVTLSKADTYALATAEKDKQLYSVTLSAGSKVITLGNTAGTWCIVHNAGDTNAFTLKNVAGDTGTSVAAGKTFFVIPSATANATLAIALN
jgi:hypothetical protein